MLDIILNMPIEEALKKVNVSKEIGDALIEKRGDFARVYDFILCYENADWQEVSRQLIVENITVNQVYEAYIEAVCWYKEMFF